MLYTVTVGLHITRSLLLSPERITRKHLLLDGLRVGAQALASGGSHDVDVASVILDSLLSAASGELLLLLRLDLGGLVLNLTGTSQRAVHLTTTSQAEHQVKGGLLLDIIVTMCVENGQESSLDNYAHITETETG